jgi:hypothetical protein
MRDHRKAFAGGSAAFLGCELAKVVSFQIGLFDGVSLPSDVVTAIQNLCIALLVYVAIWFPSQGDGTNGQK